MDRFLSENCAFVPDKQSGSQHWEVSRRNVAKFFATIAIATTTFHTCNTGKWFKRILFVLLENNRIILGSLKALSLLAEPEKWKGKLKLVSGQLEM